MVGMILASGCTTERVGTQPKGPINVTAPLGGESADIHLYNVTPMDDNDLMFMAFRYTWQDGDEYISFKPMSESGDDTPIIFYRNDSVASYVTYQFKTLYWGSGRSIGVSLKRGDVSYRTEYTVYYYGGNYIIRM